MKRLHPLRDRVLGASALALLSTLTAGQTEVLVATGDALPGLGVVDEILEVAIDDAGNWIVAVHTDALPLQGQVLIRNGAVVLKYGDVVPGYQPGFTFGTGRSLWVDGAAGFGWAAGTFTAPNTAASGVYVNQSPLAVIGDRVGAPGITPGTVYSGFYDQILEPSGSVVVHATMNDPAILGILDNVLLRLVPLAAGGAVATDLVRRGDLLPGHFSPVQEFSETLHGLASNAAGQLLYQPTFQSGGSAVYLDWTPLAKTGGQSPVFGRTWYSLRNMPVALNEAGDYAFGGRMGGDFETAHILVWNGIKLAQEGDGLPAIVPFAITDFGFQSSAPGPLRLAEDGRVLWYCAWDDPDPTRDAGLFLDHELILQEGVTWIDGARIDSFVESASFAPRPVFDMSSDASTIALRAVLTDGRTGAFLVRPGGAVETIAGCVPNTGTLLASAPPQIDKSYVLTVQNAQVDGAEALVYFALQPAPGTPPCGAPLPGLGELLVSLAPLDQLLVQPGIFPAIGGQTFAILPKFPNDLRLFGLTFYAQGFWFDTPGAVPGEPVRLTNALALSFGL